MRGFWRLNILTLLLLSSPFAVNANERLKGQPGERFHVRPGDLPAPFATQSVSNGPKLVAREAGRRPVAPFGYRVEIFAKGLSHARWIITAPGGAVILAQSRAGVVTRLLDRDGDGAADDIQTIADGFDRPHGLALHDGYLYIADLSRVWRVKWRPEGKAAAKKEAVTPLGSLGGGGGHWTRTLAFAPDGKHFYVSIGSRDNIGEEDAPRATIKQFRADGSGGRIFAHGLRNPVGIAFHPDTGSLYTVVNERDGLGDGLVPDYFTAVRDGGFYGWPYAYIGSNPMPEYAERRPDLVKASIVPDVLFQSHSAPIGLAFVTGRAFPEEWRGDAFVALKGSWNAARPTGYKIVRVAFRNGKPQGWYENFVTGFQVGLEDSFWGHRRATVIGRPAGVAIWGDRGLLIADAAANIIWWVRKDTPPRR
ncbi:MAG: PQQ-dependent sugar dehydrogenase [Alphaproteobacteria bacterium]|nr:PQQ-dependent sugar dehydrogenase [Alphaproteobacteria bacterium]